MKQIPKDESIFIEQDIIDLLAEKGIIPKEKKNRVNYCTLVMDVEEGMVIQIDYANPLGDE